jgi:hypothetical protein
MNMDQDFIQVIQVMDLDLEYIVLLILDMVLLGIGRHLHLVQVGGLHLRRHIIITGCLLLIGTVLHHIIKDLIVIGIVRLRLLHQDIIEA